MDGINQSAQSQPAPSNNQQQQSQKVAESQAEDFAKRLDKKKDGKDSKKGELEGKKGEQSLEALLAERSKTAQGKHKDRGQEQGQQGQQDQRNPADSELLGQGQLSDGPKEHVVAQTREIPPQSEIQLKGIQQVSGPKEINEVINKLVDKIHVSAKDAINGAEVRLSMKDAILPGTEIRIQRMGGELTVTMNTTSAESHNFLAQHEASLMKSLSDRFGNDKVQVNINMSGGGGEQSDGRSREEYVGEEEQQEDNDQS
ncbi:MAG: type III secretion HpaP family protein [Endozoicomonas sp.]